MFTFDKELIFIIIQDREDPVLYWKRWVLTLMLVYVRLLINWEYLQVQHSGHYTISCTIRFIFHFTSSFRQRITKQDYKHVFGDYKSCKKTRTSFIGFFLQYESTFASDECLNKHNFHYWARRNPHKYRQLHHQHHWSVNMFWGILGEVLNGPLNGHFLRESILHLLEDVPLEEVCGCNRMDS